MAGDLNDKQHDEVREQGQQYHNGSQHQEQQQQQHRSTSCHGREDGEGAIGQSSSQGDERITPSFPLHGDNDACVAHLPPPPSFLPPPAANFPAWLPSSSSTAAADDNALVRRSVTTIGIIPSTSTPAAAAAISSSRNSIHQSQPHQHQNHDLIFQSLDNNTHRLPLHGGGGEGRDERRGGGGVGGISRSATTTTSSTGNRKRSVSFSLYRHQHPMQLARSRRHPAARIECVDIQPGR